MSTEKPIPTNKVSEQRLIKKSTFLLSKIFRSKNKQSEYDKIFHEFRKLLVQIKNYMDQHGQFMYAKDQKLGTFTTLIRFWEKKSHSEIEQEISALKLPPKKTFLLYKTSDGWCLTGSTVKGKIITHSVDRIPENRFQAKKSFIEHLDKLDSDKMLDSNDPLHKLVVEYFGYYRPTCFISYSWGSKDHPLTQENDKMNQQDIHSLVKDLEIAGIRVFLDKNDLMRDDDLTRFIGLIDSSDTDYVCVMGTPLYKKKYENPALVLGGESNKTALEAESIIKRVSNTRSAQSVLRLLIDGEETTSFPTQLQGRIFCKFTENDYFDTLLSLLFTLYNYERAYEDDNIAQMIKEFNTKVRPTPPSKVVNPMKNKPVVIFAGGGVDNFAALALALAPGAFRDIKAIVACAGKVELDTTVQNVLDICHLAKRNDIPVIRGSNIPITPNHSFATDTDAHSNNGLNGIKLDKSPESVCEAKVADVVIEILRDSPKKPITLINLSGLTDIANVLQAVEQEDLLDRIAGVSLVGGVLNSKEADAPIPSELYPKKYGEFNFLLDPDATDLLFKICARRANPIPIALFERGFTQHHCRFSQEQTKLLQKNPNNLLSNRVAEALNSIPLAYQRRFFKSPSQPIHNVFPIMMLINENIFEGEWVKIRCQNSTGAYPGKVEFADESDCPTVFMITTIKPELEQAFFEIYAEKLGQYPSSSALPAAPIPPQPPHGQPNPANPPRKVKHTQAVAIIPKGMDADQMRAILDVCEGSSLPRFQFTPNSTDKIDERSAFFIVEDESIGSQSDKGMVKK